MVCELYCNKAFSFFSVRSCPLVKTLPWLLFLVRLEAFLTMENILHAVPLMFCPTNLPVHSTQATPPPCLGTQTHSCFRACALAVLSGIQVP